jgi:glutathione S-transferase
MKTPSIKLTYFDIEGAAEPVRLALVLSKTPFEDNRVQFSEWAELKPKTPGGQLPFMTIDDGPMRTQSKAMLRWVGCNLSDTLYPSDNLFEIEEAIGVAEDVQRSFNPAFYMGMAPFKFGHPEDFAKTDEGKKLVQELREKFVSEELPKYLQRFSDMLSSHGGKWLVAGENPTVADCVAVPVLRSFTNGHLDFVNTNCLDGHPLVVEYIKNFCALDGVQGRYTKGLH